MENHIYEYELIDVVFELFYDTVGDEENYYACEEGSAYNDFKPCDIEYDADGIPLGSSPEEKNIRRQMIHEFIQKWRSEHADAPRVFNKELNDYIKINQVFLLESVAHSAVKYQSTKAVLKMEEIMINARKVAITRTKEGNSNQKPFAQMMVMRFQLDGIGSVKMTIGIRKRTAEKVQYSITVPDDDKPFVDSTLRIGKNGTKDKKKKRSK